MKSLDVGVFFFGVLLVVGGMVAFLWYLWTDTADWHGPVNSLCVTQLGVVLILPNAHLMARNNPSST
jgi:hypothetical protein